MLGPRAVLASCAVLLAVLGAATPARAWTEAHVRSARAHVDVGRDGEALVALELDVRVRGGWLGGLEVAGLDPSLALLEDKPPWVVAEDGHKYSPRVRVRDDGRVQLRFPRRTGPGRGAYTVGLAYRTDLAGRTVEARPDGTVRIGWTLPGWRAGLDGVEITVLAPPGARAVVASGDDEGVQAATHERRDLGGRTLLTWRRVHLPRTVPWTVQLELPEEQVAPELRYRAPSTPEPPAEGASPTPGESPGSAGGSSPPPRPRAPWALVAAVVLAALLRRAEHRAACRRVRARPRPVLPLPEPLAGLLVVAAGAVSGWLWADRPVVGFAVLALVPLLVLERTPSSPALPRPGRWRDVTHADRQQARARCWRERLLSLDVTAPLGWLLIAGLAAAVLALDAGASSNASVSASHGLTLLAPLLLTGTRLHRPPSAEARLERLLRLAAKLRVDLETGPRFALRPAVHEDAQRRWQEARLRLRTPGRVEGLVRLDLAVRACRQLGGFRTEAVLVVVTRKGSAAERRVAEAAPEARAHSGTAQRIARVLPADAATLGRVTRAVSAPPAQRAERPPLATAA